MPAPRVIRDARELSAFLSSVADAPFLALDTETSGLDPHRDRLLLLQIGTASRQALIDARSMDPSSLRPLFSRDRVVVMHNAKFDLKMLAASYRGLDSQRHGDDHGDGDDDGALDLAHVSVMDTFLAEQILLNGRRSDLANLSDPTFSLKSLAERYAGMSLDKTIRENFFGATSTDQLSEEALRYAARDVEATWKIFAAQLPRLEREGLIRSASIEGASACAFARMELAGAPIDQEAWRALVSNSATESATAKRALDREFASASDRDLFGESTLNFDSDQEVLAALKRLGLDLDTTKREVLLASGHPAAAALVEYREHQKIVSTYGEVFLGHVHSATGRIHPNFHAIGAVSGRSSCSDPNLQNIPAGSAFRRCFRAPPGRKLITADYAGAELRIIAEASRDPVFVRAFSEGKDLHAIVAEQIFGKPVSRTENPDLRARAKAINFGLAYGMGTQGLANQIGITLQDAEVLLERYFRSFPKIRDYLNASARAAFDRGYAETMSGRKYWLTDMRRQGRDEASQLRVAKNMPIQGTNADMTKLAMARVTRSFLEQRLDAFLINMIHDELVVEASEADALAAREVLEKDMISAASEFVRSVPIEVDLHVDVAWSK